MAPEHDEADGHAMSAQPWHGGRYDYYAVLGVARTATADEVRRAYEEKAFILDAGRYRDAPPGVRQRAEREMALVEQAFQVLSDAGLRQLNDEELDRLAAFRSGAARTDMLSGDAASAFDTVAVAAGPSPSSDAQAPDVPESGGPPSIGGKPWGVPAILLALALPVLVWVLSLIGSVTMAADEELTQGEIVSGLVLTIVLDFSLIGLAVGFSLWRYRLDLRELGLRPFDRSLWWLPIVAAGGAQAGIVAYSVVLTQLGADAAIPEQEDLSELFESRALLPLAAVATLLMAPLAEEIFFRGFIFAGLIRPFGVGVAMAVSGLIFAAFHVTGSETLGLIPPFAAIGVLFAWVYYRTGSLWPSIATHFLFNLVSFIALVSLAGSGTG